MTPTRCQNDKSWTLHPQDILLQNDCKLDIITLRYGFVCCVGGRITRAGVRKLQLPYTAGLYFLYLV